MPDPWYRRVTALDRQWRIARRPTGRPLRESDFEFAQGTAREPGPGEIQVRTLFLGFDAAQKGWMENASDSIEPTCIGQVMPALAIGTVTISNSAHLVPGDKVYGLLGWQDYSTVCATTLTKLPDDNYLSANLGVLGVTGMTAFFGLQRVGKPFVGDTLVITGAAGATGSLVGQLGKLAGCRVIGIAGGPRKTEWLIGELGFDAAIDYRAFDFEEQLAATLSDGIDVLWDNVGGSTLNTLLAYLARHARVVVCGAISRSVRADSSGPDNYYNLMYRRATMEGFGAFDYRADYPHARAKLAALLSDGRLKYREDIQHGLENAPQTLMRLFAGDNIGKQILKI